MAITSASGERTEEVLVPKKWRQRDQTSPERRKVWTEPMHKAERKVAVVYYLYRNGQLEHPHFLEVPLSLSEGLYLRDVINRLDFLRGKGMARMYSWASKRSYKTGFVWQDLTENDFIYPVHGQEYVLKGSELPEASSTYGSQEVLSALSLSSERPQKYRDDSEFPVTRRNSLWSSIDVSEYKVYKADSLPDIPRKATDASTQTDEEWRRRKPIREEHEHYEDENEETRENSAELGRDEISPPPSSSSPETLESLMKADVKAVHRRNRGEEGKTSEIGDQTASDHHQNGKSKASAKLKQLISCGSVSVREDGFSLISHYGGRLPRGAQMQENEISVSGTAKHEDKEYFSGSFVEMKKGNDSSGEFQGLKRSSSYNADRCSKSELAAENVNTVDGAAGAHSKCLPMKSKNAVKKEGVAISRSVHGSKRMDDVKPCNGF